MNPTIASYVTIVVEDEDTARCPCFIAFHPELEGCLAQGRTASEAIENLKEASDLYVESLREDGLDIPPPQTTVTQTVGVTYYAYNSLGCSEVSITPLTAAVPLTAG